MSGIKGFQISDEIWEGLGAASLLIFLVLGGVVHPVLGLTSFFLVRSIESILVGSPRDAALSFASMSFGLHIAIYTCIVVFKFLIDPEFTTFLTDYAFFVTAWVVSVGLIGLFILWKGNWNPYIFIKIWVDLVVDFVRSLRSLS